MDGLECSEIHLLDLDSSSRLDSEFYSKEYVYESNKLLATNYFNIGQHFKVTDGEHGSVEYIDNGVKYLTAENIKHGYVDISKIRYVSEDVHKRNARASVKEGDILISIKGTLGSIAIATKELTPCNMNRDVAIIKPLSALTKSNYFVAIFLMSKYGALQSQRGGSGGVQQMITLGRLREFVIPELSDEFYDEMKNAYNLFLEIRKKSENVFYQAEYLLEDEIQINTETHKSSNVAVKTLSESFGTTGRLDAEYYQQKYDELVNEIGTEMTIGTECNIYDKTFTPLKESQYAYIELANIGNLGEIEDVEIIPGSDLPTRARRICKKGQILVSSVEGSLKSCAIVTDEYDGALCSTGFYVIDSSKYNSETLLVLLKSKYIQMLLKRGCSGTILTNISKDEFLNIVLPDVSKEVQEKIKIYLSQTNEYRNKSNQILASAIKAVEMAIEQDESTSIKWLDEQIKNILSK